MQRGFVQFIILGVLGLIIIAAGAFYLGKQTSAPKSQSQNQVVTSQITPSPTASPAPNGTGETAGWKTYTGKYFTFKYPTSWNLDSDNNTSLSLSITRTTTNKAGGDYTPGMGWLNIDVSNDSVQKIIDSTMGVEKKDQSNIDNIPSIRLVGHSGAAGSTYFIDILMNNQGKTFVVNFSTQDSSLESSLTSELDQILSTFKFTN